MHLKNWTVKRSGSAVVVYGRDAASDAMVKLTRITEISINEAGWITATREGAHVAYLLAK